MDVEPLWRSRLRWRWRGAMLWPTFLLLTVGDAWLLRVLPIAGDGPTEPMGALLLAGFFNLVAVAVGAPLLGRLLRRRRPDMPKIVATDVTGTALVVLVTLGLLAGGLIHAPVRAEAERDLEAQAAAARAYAHARAPAEYRDGIGAMTTVKLEDEVYRTCVPGPDPKRWFCMYVFTDTTPPGIEVDRSRESNESLNRLGAYR
jgi:hypothetical protein